MADSLGIIWLILVTVVLPIALYWIYYRKQIELNNKRIDFVMSALEKNPELDVEECLKRISPKGKSLKEKLLGKLTWGIIISCAGICFIVFGTYLLCSNRGGADDSVAAYVAGGGALAIGAALISSYFVGKKLMAKEIQAEELERTQK